MMAARYCYGVSNLTKIFMRVTCSSIDNTEHVRRLRCPGAFCGADQGIKVTSELLEIEESRTCSCNLTFDSRKSSNQEPRKGTIK